MVIRIDFGSEEALYVQLYNQIIYGIANADLRQGDTLPSVRELASTLGVNPNTVQRAMETMEEQGLLYSVRGSGWFVRQDTSRAVEVLDRLRWEKTADFFRTMEILGLSTQEVKEFVKEWDYE